VRARARGDHYDGYWLRSNAADMYSVLRAGAMLLDVGVRLACSPILLTLFTQINRLTQLLAAALPSLQLH
jgi:hypothetical protein